MIKIFNIIIIMSRQVIILQDKIGTILGVEGSLKKIAELNSHILLSYIQLHRLVKAAKNKGQTEVQFKGRSDKDNNRKDYTITWWSI